MTGIIIIDKPSGMTSFGAVARVRRICSTKKCGHTGTLGDGRADRHARRGDPLLRAA